MKNRGEVFGFILAALLGMACVANAGVKSAAGNSSENSLESVTVQLLAGGPVVTDTGASTPVAQCTTPSSTLSQAIGDPGTLGIFVTCGSCGEHCAVEEDLCAARCGGCVHEFACVCNPASGTNNLCEIFLICTCDFCPP